MEDVKTNVNYQTATTETANTLADYRASSKARFINSYSEIDNENLPYTVTNINGKNVILVGSTGQVGVAILRRLLAAEANICAFYNTEKLDVQHKLLTWKQLDLKSKILDLRSLKADILIYTAPLWFLPNLLKFLEGSGLSRLVCFSSTSVYTKPNSGNKNERDMVNRMITSESDIVKLCEARHIDYTIIRPTMVYGIGFDKNICFITNFIRKFGFFPTADDANGLRQPVHADDLAIAVMQILANPNCSNKIYNLCGEEKISYHEMVGRIFDTLGKKRRFLSLPILPILVDFANYLGLISVNGEMMRRMKIDMVFDDNDARDDFGYNPRPFLAEGLKNLGLVNA